MQHPPFTFVLFTYKQEKYVRASLESLLAQDYSSLEIIVSDDCSPDRTFEIIEEVASAYQGPHRLTLNRNPQNLGIGAHVQKMLSMVKTDWCFLCAGDDISLPDRASRTAQESIKNPRLRVIGSNYYRMRDDGKLFIENPFQPQQTFDRNGVIRTAGTVLSGCTMAIHRDCWEKFPPISSAIKAEDTVLCLRAGLLGELLLIEEPLVHYRLHGENATQVLLDGYFQLPEKDLSVRQFCTDVEGLKEQGLLSESEARHAISELYRYHRYHYYRLHSYGRGVRSLISLVRAAFCLSIRKDWPMISSKLRNIFPQIREKIFKK